MNEKTNIWHKKYKPWLTFNNYFNIEDGLEVDASEIPSNYITIKTEQNVYATKTHRIVKRTIIVRKRDYKQGELQF